MTITPISVLYINNNPTMKLILISVFMLVLAQAASAQKVRISDPTNKCVISVFYNNGPRSGSDLFHWSFSGKVNLGQYTYSKFDTGSTYTPYKYIREDTTLNIVYGLNSAGDEEILYDYNWQTGDSIGLISIGIMRVESIDTVKINGYDHKVFNIVDQPNGAYPQTIVEGFGNITYPFWRVAENASATPYATIVCFSNANGTPTVVETTPIQHQHFGLSLCKSVGIASINNEANLSIYPQPAHNEFTIQLPTEVTGKMIIINGMGQTVYTHNIAHEASLNINGISLNTGVYYYRINSSNAKVNYSGKLLID